MRRIQGCEGGSRGSALWGSGKRGGDRRGARLVTAAAVVALAGVVAATAGAANGNGPGWRHGRAFVPPPLAGQAQADPGATFHVIVQGDAASSTAAVGAAVGGRHGRTTHSFTSIHGVAAELTGGDLARLANDPHIASITPDTPLTVSSYQPAESWRDAGEADVRALWGSSSSPAPPAPAIAFVDSGISMNDGGVFGNRIVANVDLCSTCSSASVGNFQGHGTMVAGIAAGARTYAYGGGVAPQAPIVMLRTADQNGQSLTSDVITAIDWILANKDRYNIRVANFSLVGNAPTSFLGDPLDQAVEKLWFSGVVVVTAAGNYGTAGSAVDMSYAPGNDPFVITVGATDVQSDGSYSNDSNPGWSAYGHTMDGFAKPELSAPGRYLFMPTVMGTTLTQLFPGRLYAAVFGGWWPAYGSSTLMWMSGTSFSAAAVSGAAAQILARNPGWTPDQVKGALMLTARYLPSAGWSAGVGELDAAAAAAVASPPNANANLDSFVATGADGQSVFDGDAWVATVTANPLWTTANWTSANWTSANWTSANWTSANWTSANWTSANWTSANWTSANWTSANWTATNVAASAYPE
jgi:serine protease AprX